MTQKPLSFFLPRSRTSWAMAGFIMFVGSLISYQIALIDVQQRHLEQQGQAINELAPMRARLEGAVLNLFSATSGIAGVIAHKGDISQDLFNALSRQAVDNHSYIHNIGIAPNDVVSQLYPLDDNKQAIGLHYYTDTPLQYNDVQKARLTGEPIFSGPHQLVQGGQGLIARVPVFTKTEVSAASPRYWGVVSVVTNMHILLEAAAVHSTNDFIIGLRKMDTQEPGSSTILLGQAELFSNQNPVCMPVKLPGVRWQLCAAPKAGWPVITATNSMRLYIGLLYTASLALFVGWLAERPQNIHRHNLDLQHEINERIQTEESLRFSEQKYASIFQLMPDMAGITRLEDGCFLEINVGFSRVSGWSAEEVIGHTSIDLGLWTIDERMQAVGLLQAHGYLENFPFLLKLKSGELHHALMSLTPIQVNGVECLYFMARDINALKLVQIHLEQERSHLRNLLQSVPAMIWMKDPQGIYLSCNSRFERFIGQKEASIIGQTDFDFFEQNEAEWFHSYDQKAITKKTASINEEWITYADDGHRELVETIKTPVYDPGGTLLGVLGIAWDITEKKRIEEELLRERTRFINLVDSVDGIVWETDACTLTFTYVSREAQRLLGYPIDQWYGDSFWSEHLHPEDRDRVYKMTEEATARGEDHELSYRFLAADGRIVWIQDRINVVMVNEQPRWRRGIMVDTTQEKEAEHRRLSLENQLLQAQKIEAIGRLAGGVAHDFNNQLSVILGYADLMQQSHVTEEKRRGYTNQIIRAASQSRDITRQLLAFSRQEVNSPQVLDLNLLVKGIKKGIGRLIREDIRVEVRSCKDLWTVFMDSTQMDQILMNLIVNARDAIVGHGVISLETSNVTLDASFTNLYPEFTPGEYVLLCVQDTGSGMSRDTILHIFEPFYTTKETGKGTGLGLATVYGIVTQNNGHVLVESELGAGTTFKVFLPRSHAQFSEEAIQPTRSILPQHSGTILLVEDEETVRQMAQDILTASGYTVLVAAGPSEALDICHKTQQPIDLLLSDIIMPEMNGRELCEQIRKLRPDIKTVFMSGYAGDILQEENDAQVPLIKKPFTLHSLLKTLEDQFQNLPSNNT
ncbi:MAG: PAS domain S-box protein [Desulfobulbus sp.]|nr:PAS domain S-box protein [Desulfobulbus sp.]